MTESVACFCVCHKCFECGVVDAKADFGSLAAVESDADDVLHPCTEQTALI